MNGLDFLNLVIGLIFIYLIYSIAASTIWEIIVSISNLKGRMMHNWVLENFNEATDEANSEMGNKILDHHIIKGLVTKSSRKPVYISSELFTDVLVDLIVDCNTNDEASSGKKVNIKSFKKNLKETKLLNQGLQRVFLQYLEGSDTLKDVKDKIGRWYDEAQERLIGTFKKSLQIWIFVISLVLVCATNADTIKLASYLYNNPDTRLAIAKKVDLLVQDTIVINNLTKIDTTIIDSLTRMEQKEILNKIDHDLKTLEELNDELQEVSIPIGWANEKFDSYSFWDILKKIGGLLLSVFAVSLGAPFWFDILNKLANLRSSGTKPKSSLEEPKS